MKSRDATFPVYFGCRRADCKVITAQSGITALLAMMGLLNDPRRAVRTHRTGYRPDRGHPARPGGSAARPSSLAARSRTGNPRSYREAGRPHRRRGQAREAKRKLAYFRGLTILSTSRTPYSG